MRTCLLLAVIFLCGCDPAQMPANKAYVDERSADLELAGNKDFRALSERIDALESEIERLKAGQATSESLANSALALHASGEQKRQEKTFIIWVRRTIYARDPQHVLVIAPPDKAYGSYSSRIECLGAAAEKVKELGGNVRNLTYQSDVPENGNYWQAAYICLPEGMRP